MSHLVIYEVDGIDQYERFVAIDEAVALVERLRNEGNPSARMYRLEEIKFEVKAYYRVEVGAAPPPAIPVPQEPDYETPAETPTVPVTSVEAPAAEPMMVASSADDEIEPAVTDAIADPAAEHDEYAVSTSLGGARRGLFGR